MDNIKNKDEIIKSLHDHSLGKVTSITFEEGNITLGNPDRGIVYECFVAEDIIIEFSSFYNLEIEKVVFNPPYTVLNFHDGSKEIVKTDGIDDYNPEVGLAMAISKRVFGSRGNFMKFVDKHTKKVKCSHCQSVAKFNYERGLYFCTNEECDYYSCGVLYNKKKQVKE